MLETLIKRGDDPAIQALDIVHFSEKKLKHSSLKQELIKPMNRDNIIHGKPWGLWFSIESSEYNWSWWCKAENFHLYRMKWVNTLLFKPDARIVYLDTLKKVLRFNKLFCINPYPDMPFSLRYLDWTQVLPLCDGIIISPYFWQLRMRIESFWYYTWDCASGCIWNFDTFSVVNSRKYTEWDKKDESNN